MSSAYMPADAAVAINDMLDCCAVGSRARTSLFSRRFTDCTAAEISSMKRQLDSVGSAGARRASYRNLDRYAEQTECDLARYPYIRDGAARAAD
jgi:hypothetical protein